MHQPPITDINVPDDQGDVFTAAGVNRCEFKSPVCDALVLQTSLSICFLCEYGIQCVTIWTDAGAPERHTIGSDPKSSGEIHTRYYTVSTSMGEWMQFQRQKWVKPFPLCGGSLFRELASFQHCSFHGNITLSLSVAFTILSNGRTRRGVPPAPSPLPKGNHAVRGHLETLPCGLKQRCLELAFKVLPNRHLSKAFLQGELCQSFPFPLWERSSSFSAETATRSRVGEENGELTKSLGQIHCLEGEGGSPANRDHFSGQAPEGLLPPGWNGDFGKNGNKNLELVSYPGLGPRLLNRMWRTTSYP